MKKLAGSGVTHKEKLERAPEGAPDVAGGLAATSIPVDAAWLASLMWRARFIGRWIRRRANCRPADRGRDHAHGIPNWIGQRSPAGMDAADGCIFILIAHKAHRCGYEYRESHRPKARAAAVPRSKRTSTSWKTSWIVFTKNTYMLIAAMIIENGVDIPNCDTTPSAGRDRIGPAQLYQLRATGRGDPADRRAHAPFDHPAIGTPQRCLSWSGCIAIENLSDPGFPG